jgi:hypothetical protein
MLTELNAINIMLRGIGQSPVTSAGLQHPHAIAAKNTFDILNEEVQADGWWFNEDIAVTLVQDSAGEIILPANVLRADPTAKNLPNNVTSNLVQRGTRMYDPVNNTFVIGDSVDVDITFFLAYENLPYPAQVYIAYYSSLELHSDTIGDNEKMQRLSIKVDKLYSELKTADIRNRNVNAQLSSGAARLLAGVRPVSSRN